MFWIIGSGVLGVVILTAVYHLAKEWRQTIVFFGSSLGISAAIIAAILGVMGLQESARQHSFAIRQSQKQAAFSYAQEWQRIPQAKLRQASKLARELSPEDIHKALQNDPELADAVRATIVYFEEVGLAVRLSYADEEPLRALLYEPVSRYHSAFKPWMDWYKNYRSVPTAFENYQWLEERWANDGR